MLLTGLSLVAATMVRKLTRLRMSLSSPVRWSATSPNEVRTILSAQTGDILEEAWATDAEIKEFTRRGGTFFAQPLETESHGIIMHGAIAWAEGGGSLVKGKPRPGILLLHTAVGPQDIFLRWRAQALAARGFVVLIADLFGDPTGRGWDPEFAAPARQVYVENRHLLLLRTQDALQSLAASPLVDGTQLAAMGFCFGGRAASDLIKSRPDGLRAILTFHGVVDDYAPPGFTPSTTIDAQAFLAHADADPFVPRPQLDGFLAQLRQAKCRWQLQAFGGSTVHAFTNPAQEINESPNFDYDPMAAQASWSAANTFLDAVFPDRDR